MSKKENEREVTSLLARIRESLRRPKKEDDAEELIEDSLIHNEIMGSDHCPVELIIKI